MVFSSLTFLCLALPAALIVYYIVPRRLKNAWLLLFSLIFYAWGEPRYILLMLGTIVLNWAFALIMERSRAQKKALLAMCVAANLLLLVVFKYSALLVASFNRLTGMALAVPQIALPIGISFYTFQAMSYAIDVYRKDVPAQPRIDKVALYISLFPQLIAGPIVRYVDVAAQIDERHESFLGFSAGMERFVIGLSKKVLIANALAPLADEAFALAGRGLGAGGAWLGLICYAMQIYFDFSGYSDMAIGLGRMFGFDFMENFNHPYISSSIREFWNRWHISLGTWFRDYLYIPLGGNRVRPARRFANIIIVFLLTGLWHGASWSFLIWGAYHGIARGLESLADAGRGPKLARIFLTQLLVLCGWVLFKGESMAQTCAYFAAMIGQGGALALTHLTPKAVCMCLVALLAATPFPARLMSKWNAGRAEAVKGLGMIILLLMSMAALSSSAYNPFIYFCF